MKWQPASNPPPDDSIWIESTRDRGDQGRACLLRWGAVERYAAVADVRQTAEDLFTCAAYAELLGELLRIGLDGQTTTEMLRAMLDRRQPRFFGTLSTLFLLPGGSSVRREGVVLLARRDLFHKGHADACLSPDEARTMGRTWFAVAEASESDTLFGGVLERAGWMSPTEMDALFGLLYDIRSGTERIGPIVPVDGEESDLG